MSAAVPARFWGSPFRYLRWAAHEKPAIFWACVLGAGGPVSFVVIPPLRRWVGDENPPRIPLTYPGTLFCLHTCVRGKLGEMEWGNLEAWGRWTGEGEEEGVYEEETRHVVWGIYSGVWCLSREFLSFVQRGFLGDDVISWKVQVC